MSRRRPFSSAFEAPGYRWLWLNSLFGSVALTVETLSHGWLVLQLTDSPFWVGVVAGARGITQFAFSVLGGTIGDRVDRRRILLMTQGLQALGMTALAFLVLSGTVRVWHVVAFAILQGFVGAIEQPTAHGLMYDLVGGERLLNASAFRFMAGSLVRTVGAIAGGYIIDRLGVGQNYLLASGAHLTGLGCMMRLAMPVVPARPTAPLVTAVVEGLRYARRTRRIRQSLFLSVIIEAFGFSYNSMLPVMARDVLRVGGVGLGYLSAASGLGQLAATLFVASRGHLLDKGRLVVVSALGFGTAVALFGLSPWFPASLLLVAVVGGLGSAYDAGMATLLLTAASDEMRARVQGLYFSTISFSQVGGFGAGILATILGAPVALAAGGSIAAAGALALLRSVRRLSGPDG
ncbi:MAG: MFS transporter [Armatimonadota bacterium]